MIFLVLVAVLLVAAWVYVVAVSKGTSTEAGWLQLAVRLALFGLTLVYFALREPALRWLAVAVLLLWAVLEFAAWRRREPQRAAEQLQRRQHRDEVEAALEQYRRLHPSDGAGGGSSTPPKA
jgi:hypothetical protein